MRNWTAAGLDPAAFWDMGPAEYVAVLRGANDRIVREHNDRVQAAWLGAQLTAYAPAKSHQFPKLEKLLIQEGPRKRQSWQQIKAALMFAMPPKPEGQ